MGELFAAAGGVMRFSGRLQIEADPHNWLKADLMVAKGRVELVSGSDLLGSWSTGQVVAERVEADRFSLQLGEDRALFIADDALSFSYEAMPQLNKRQLLPVGVMDKLKAGLRGEDAREPAAAIEPAVASPSESPAASAGKRLRELIKEASGQASTTSETPALGAVEKRSGHSLEGLLRGRAADHGDVPQVERVVDQAALEMDGELSTEDLLERLFDAPDAPEPELIISDHSPLPGSFWADSVVNESPVEPAEESPVEPEEESPVEQGKESPPVVDPWRSSEEPVDLSFNETPGWGGSSLSSRLSTRPAEKPSWASTFQPEEAAPAVVSTEVVDALNQIVVDVKSGGLSAEQVDAITALVQAVAEAVRPKI